MKCPHCQAEAAKVGASWICPQHGQVSSERPVTPLRIFLSYGHDANEELVRRIKADLEKRGHDVWSDKSEIKAGDDWRRSVPLAHRMGEGSGVRAGSASHRVGSFLSKHSTRDPGLCRFEIAAANRAVFDQH